MCSPQEEKVSDSSLRARHELEQNIIKHVKAARGIADFSSKLSFEKLLLKFPQIEDGFVRMENAFKARSLDAESESWDPSRKTVSVQQAKEARRALKINASEEHLQKLFPMRSDPNIEVHFPDFVVALAIILIDMTPSKAKEGGADPAVVESLTLAIASFNHFDKDGNGSLAQEGGDMQEEVTGTMGEVDNSAHARRTQNPGQGEAGDISKRWQLMDLNKDGRATFRDYINSLHHWVLEPED